MRKVIVLTCQGCMFTFYKLTVSVQTRLPKSSRRASVGVAGLSSDVRGGGDGVEGNVFSKTSGELTLTTTL